MSYSGCGFIGAFAFNGFEEVIHELPFSKMLHSIAHRGPDHGGSWDEAGIILGHRRLSIIDLSSKGNQPMTCEDHTIIYNGELYNYKILQEELIKCGHTFESDTDTEVVLKAYQEWGVEALNKFTGMFAIAIWDANKRNLFLARDRFGIKPLYYHKTDKLIIFGSEVQCLMHSGKIKPDINYDALKRQVHLNTLLDYETNETLVKDVYSLKPAEYIVVQADTTMKRELYYNLAERKNQRPLTDLELVEDLTSIFSDCVSDHLVSDVSVAAFLSGGLDSSLLCALAAKSIDKLTAITVDYQGGSKDKFTGEQNNDLYYSKKLAESMGVKIDHKIITLNPAHITIENIDALTDLAMVCDDDRLLTIYSNYKAVKQQGIKVVLNGQGADEIMGGYIAYLDKCELFDEKIAINDRLKNAIEMLSFMQDKNLSQDMLSCKSETYKVFFKYYSSFSGKTTIEKYHRMLVSSQLHRILKFEDYISMQHSIECRVPFLDHRLVDWCFQIPFKKHIEFTEPPMGKMILRKVAKTLLPKELVDRPKQVFPSSDENIFYTDLLDIANNNKEAIFKCKAIKAVYKDGIKDHCSDLSFKELWLLVSLWRWETKLMNYKL